MATWVPWICEEVALKRRLGGWSWTTPSRGSCLTTNAASSCLARVVQSSPSGPRVSRRREARASSLASFGFMFHTSTQPSPGLPEPLLTTEAVIPAAATSIHPRAARIRSTPLRTRPSLRTDVSAWKRSSAAAQVRNRAPRDKASDLSSQGGA